MYPLLLLINKSICEDSVRPTGIWVPLDCFTRAGCFLHSLFLFICILNCKSGLLLDHRLTTEFQQRLLYVERIYWAFRHSRAKEIERPSYYYGQYFSYPAFSDSWWMTNVMHKFSSMCLFLFTTLYMFWAHSAHHERQIVSIQPLVTVILCLWLRCVQDGRRILPSITQSFKKI